MRPKVVPVSPCVRVPAPYHVDWALKRKDVQRDMPVSPPTDQIPWFGPQKGCPKVEQLYGPRFAQAQAIDGKPLTLRVLSPLRTQIGCACSMWDELRLASANGRRSEWSGPRRHGNGAPCPASAVLAEWTALRANEPAFAAFSMDSRLALSTLPALPMQLSYMSTLFCLLLVHYPGVKDR